MHIFNRNQPIRPRVSPETGKTLLYRTFPMMQSKMPAIMTEPYQKTQILMYRALNAKVFPNHAPAGEIKEWLMTTHVVLGSTIIQALLYEARKLWGSRVSKPKIIYSFSDMLELQYGLEWQICTWLPTFLKERDSHESDIPVNLDMSEELSWLAECDEATFNQEYFHPLGQSRFVKVFEKMQLEATRLPGHPNSWAERVKGLVEDVPEPTANVLSRSVPKSVKNIEPDDYEPF